MKRSIEQNSSRTPPRSPSAIADGLQPTLFLRRGANCPVRPLNRQCGISKADRHSESIPNSQPLSVPLNSVISYPVNQGPNADDSAPRSPGQPWSIDGSEYPTFISSIPKSEQLGVLIILPRWRDFTRFRTSSHSFPPGTRQA